MLDTREAKVKKWLRTRFVNIFRNSIQNIRPYMFPKLTPADIELPIQEITTPWLVVDIRLC